MVDNNSALADSPHAAVIGQGLRRPNRYAVRAGAALFATASLVLLSGVFLTRFGFLEVNDPVVRRAAYWLHVLAPFVAVWLFILHRLAGRPEFLRIKTFLALRLSDLDCQNLC